MDELERCNREIADIEALLRSGHPEMQGLCLALSDWSAERRILIGLGRSDLASRTDVMNQGRPRGKESSNRT